MAQPQRGPGTSRRSFPRKMGLTGGAGAMFAAMGALGRHPSYGFHGERGVMIGHYNYNYNYYYYYYYYYDAADSYAKLTPKEREKRTVAVGVKIYGEKYRTELASSFSHHWRQAPYLKAAWHDTPGGPDHARYRPLNEPTARVYFAGDWLSYTDAWQHGAFTSARKAVTALHARVLSS